jgi:hypothetical protein
MTWKALPHCSGAQFISAKFIAYFAYRQLTAPHLKPVRITAKMIYLNAYLRAVENGRHYICFFIDPKRPGRMEIRKRSWRVVRKHPSGGVRACRRSANCRE